MNKYRAVDSTRQLHDIETSGMAEESSNEYTPLDLSMKGEAILQDTETSGMAEESSNEYTPLDLSMKGEAMPSTSRDGTQGTSSAVDAYRTIADYALPYQGVTQHTPMTEETCNVDGAPDNGSRSCQPLGSIRGIDIVRPTTIHARMEEASANIEDGAMNATGSVEREQQESSGVSAKVSSRRDTLQGLTYEHARALSSVKKSSRQCEKCGKWLSSAGCLTVHYRTHTGEKPYKCEICGKSVASTSHLRSHQRIHTGVKPHTCQICTKAFKNKAELKGHLISHSNDRPLVCDICNLSFKRNSELLRHRKRIHEGKLPYECKKCGFRSSKKGSIDAHVCKNIRCELCKASFTDAPQLIAHLVVHTGGGGGQS
ncbi:zinc finger protein 32-like [Dermacentor albipictus]|uniref:zinc finger protein 32-like n=1 Tax=Dermacentor albipictus TaxID=60249 RepID=UPI0038FBFA4E